MALDIACQALRSGDSSMVRMKLHFYRPPIQFSNSMHQALVAGASLIHNLETWIGLSNMNFLSPDSKCYSFDDRANG